MFKMTRFSGQFSAMSDAIFHHATLSSPLLLKRNKSTLKLQKLICHNESERFSDEARIRVWGDEFFTKRYGDFDGDETRSVNHTMTFSNTARVLLTEKDGESDVDLLGFDKISEKDSQITEPVQDTLTFSGSNSLYTLYYTITRIPDPITTDTTDLVVTPSPNKAILKLKSLICLDTTEEWGDDVTIRIGDKKRKKKIDKNQVRHFGTDHPDREPTQWGENFPFDTTITVTLHERDSGLLFGDESIGTNLIHPATEKISLNNMKTYRENNTLFYLIYDLIPVPDDPGDNSFIHVHPLHFIQQSHNIIVRFVSFIPLKRPVFWESSTDNENEKVSGEISPADWQVTIIDDTDPDTNVYHIQKRFKYVPSKLTVMNVKFDIHYFTHAATFTGLPATLSDKHEESFEVILGSCFEFTFDKGRVAAAYKRLYPTQSKVPHSTFLTGDQVYLDHFAQDFLFSSFSGHELACRFYAKYFSTYQALPTLLERGSHYFLSDDHDFFNGYPFRQQFMIGYSDSLVQNWINKATALFKTLQSDTPVSTFTIGNELSFFIADTRINRDKRMIRFLKKNHFEALLDWIENLKTPGVLVLSQPILQLPGDSNDVTQSNYGQYSVLVKAISESLHDIVILSGDVHFSRFAEVELAKHKAKLYEVISSPLSLVEATSDVGDHAPRNGDFTYEGAAFSRDPAEYIATSRWRLDGSGKPKLFPPEFVTGIIVGSERKAVSYIAAGSPKSQSEYRTEENFSRIRFFKGPDMTNDRGIKKSVNMEVQTYMVRRKPESTNSTDPPVLDWSIMRTLF